ncbi:MAG TPA: glutamine-hydrolyzing GMP synthase [Dehalococcoidia bacterium]|nr:glutamine-hydrolyzing GMP synthase [Dehalococcoidia bacterium]
MDRSSLPAGQASPGRRTAVSDHVEQTAYLGEAQARTGRTVSGSQFTPAGVEPGEIVVVLDFGSQYSLLIARRVRELNVYCDVLPWNTSAERIASLRPKGIILSGGPASVYDPGAPLIPPHVLAGKTPVLGICYGMQALAYQLGGKVAPAQRREYGHAVLHQQGDAPLWNELPTDLSVWMSHGDQVLELPPGFHTLAFSDNSPIAAMANDAGVYGIQFHPEVVHTPQGKEILRNFLYEVCGCSGNWTSGNFVAQEVEHIRRQVGDGRILCALSGGVDSAVTATLVHRAVGDQLTCVFVDNGLLRFQEAQKVLNTFARNLRMNVVAVNATERFLTRLANVTDPEEKRKRIGEEFIRVFEEEASKLGRVDFLAQGTLYPDVIESAVTEANAAARIKSHHNVGGLPDVMSFTLVEPLRYLFKDEVREVGLELGLPEEMVWRQPFPGPGLAIRILGEVTWERLETLRLADAVLLDEVRAAGLYRELWQSFAVLTPVRTVGVMGDDRTYSNVLAIRAVTSEDAMTADWARLPYDLLARVSNRLINEVPGINRVVYDITSKPPGTIEWE